MKKLLALLVCTSAYPFMHAQEPSFDENKILAVVGDVKITEKDLAESLEPLIEKIKQQTRNQKDFEQMLKSLSESVLKDMTDNALLVAEFNDRGYKLGQAAIDNLIQDDLESSFGGDPKKFERYLSDKNLSKEEYRKKILDKMAAVQMRAIHMKTFSPEISDKQMQKYYENNKRRWHTPEQIQFSRLLVFGENAKDVKKKTAAILEDIKNGADIKTIPLKYGLKESDSYQDGSGTWLSKEQVPEHLREELFSLNPGDISKPDAMTTYTAIFRLIEKKASETKSFESLREEIRGILETDERNVFYENWLNELRKKHIK